MQPNARTYMVVAPLSRQHGVQYLIVAVMAGGILQVALGALGAARLIRLVPRSVMVGFVNALAILIFMSQLPQLRGVPWLVYPMVVSGVSLIAAFSKLTSVLPPPLVAIAALTAAAIGFRWAVPTVGNQGQLPTSLPRLSMPDVALHAHTFAIIAPCAVAMATVGLLESVMTAEIVDEITGTPSNKTREALGQGIANVVTGLFGGMGGCAVLGQTMINVRISGARTRL